LQRRTIGENHYIRANYNVNIPLISNGRLFQSSDGQSNLSDLAITGLAHVCSGVGIAAGFCIDILPAPVDIKKVQIGKQADFENIIASNGPYTGFFYCGFQDIPIKKGSGTDQ